MTFPSNAHRPLLGATIFFSFGILLGVKYHFPFSFIFCLLFSLLMAYILLSAKRMQNIYLMYLCITLLGLVYLQSYQYLAADHITFKSRYLRFSPLQLEGLIVSDVQERDFFKGKKTTFHLDVKRMRTKRGWRKAEGLILVNVFREIPFEYGDIIRIEGKLHKPFNFSDDDRFSYKDYLNNRGIHLILSVKKDGFAEVLQKKNGIKIKRIFLKIRNRCKSVFSDYLTKNESAIMQAILLGDRSQIPSHIRDLFVRTGTAHILAISGLHIGVVAFLILTVLKLIPIGRKPQLLLTIIFLSSYAFLTGGRPSVIRATIMMNVFLTSLLIEKEGDILSNLSLAAMIILLANPMSLFDIGFQLSFVCVLSIILMRNPILNVLTGHSQERLKTLGKRFLYQSLSISLAVWIGVLGLILYYFNIITPITIIANLFVIPLIAAVVTLGFGLLLFGVFLEPYGFIIVPCIKVVLNLMVGGIFLFEKIPLAYIYLSNVHIVIVVVYYSVLLLAIALPWPLMIMKARGFILKYKYN